MTTVFLRRHMALSGNDRSYVCIDTFEGFTQAGIEYEVEKRGKSRKYNRGFRYGNEKVFRRHLARQGFSDIKVIKSDVAEVDFSSIALIDVDIFTPTYSVLCRSEAHLSRMAMVMVDDVRSPANLCLTAPLKRTGNIASIDPSSRFNPAAKAEFSPTTGPNGDA